LGLDSEFIEGNALSMPFVDDSFDLTLSHTVIEHVETQLFLREQRRIRKPGGRIVVTSVRTRLNVAPENWIPISGEERELFDKLWAGVDMELDRQNNVAKFEMRECDFMPALENAGFQDVDVSFISLLRYAPDNYSTTSELAEKMINGNRMEMMESTAKALRRNPGGLTIQEQMRLRELIDARFDRRLLQYHQKEKLWDIATSTVMIVSGKKA
jgi:ubiquinone/menaquinone biosynthesis C-methylase UbiE